MFDPEDGVRISKALIKAIGEAQVLAGAGDVGPQFRDTVQHARELYDLLLEQLVIAESHAIPYLKGMSEAMGNRLFELEGLSEGRPDPTQLN
jgi:hypothetical protein